MKQTGQTLMDNDTGEKRRRQPRYNCVSRIRYALFQEPGAEEREGYMLNMSSAGLCLAVKEPLEAGQEISITQCVASFCCRTYLVQWVKKRDEELETYIAGLMSPEYKMFH